MGIIAELKRRNVFRVGAAYVVTAWLVIQVVETIFPAFGFGDAAIRYVTVAFAVGLLPVLITAWVFELTPEGLKRESELAEDRPASVNAAKRLDRIILLVLALALGYFAFDKFLLEPEREARLRQQQEAELAQATEAARQEGRSEAFAESFGDQSIAVLPFVNMSSDPEQEYFSDGISEEILNALAQIPELRVISRSSSFAYKNRTLETPEIARLLNVAHVLEGSVRRSGDTVRITAQLIEAQSDTHLWSQTWDREFRDVFAIQDEISAQVSEKLQLTLMEDYGKSVEVDPKAYELVLRGRHLLYDSVTEKAMRAESMFKEAIAIAPAYASAHAGLAEAYRQQLGRTQRDRDEELALIEQQVATALELDPEDSQALTIRGFLVYFTAQRRDAEAARALFQKAIRVNPSNADALRWMAYTFQATDPQQYAHWLREAYRVDPARPVINQQLAAQLIQFGRFEEAMQITREYHRQNPDDWRAYQLATWILSLQGRQEEALMVYYRAFQLDQDSMPYDALVWHLIDHLSAPTDLVTAWLEYWMRREGEGFYRNGGNVMPKLAHLIVSGQGELAIHLAERALEDGVLPPRFAAYLILRAVPDYQRVRLLYEREFSSLGIDATHFDPGVFRRWDMYIDYSLTLKYTGERDWSLSLAEEILSYASFIRSEGVIFGPAAQLLPFLEAELLAIEDRPRDAIAALRRGIETGYFICGVCLRVFPHFNALRDRPEFETVLREIEGRNAAAIQRLEDKGMLLTPEEVLAVEAFEFDPFAGN